MDEKTSNLHSASMHNVSTRISIQLQCPSQTFTSIPKTPSPRTSECWKSPGISVISSSSSANIQYKHLAETIDGDHKEPPNRCNSTINERRLKDRKRSVEFKEVADLHLFPKQEPLLEVKSQQRPKSLQKVIKNIWGRHFSGESRELISQQNSTASTIEECQTPRLESIDVSSLKTTKQQKSNNNLFDDMARQFHLKHSPFLTKTKRSSKEEEHRGKSGHPRLKTIYRRMLSREDSTTSSSDGTLNSTQRLQQRNPLIGEAFCNSRIRRSAFWFIVLCLAALTVKDVINLIIEYSRNPKKSDMNIRFNDSITFPNITFCMSRAQAWSHFLSDQNNFSLMSETESRKQWDRKIEERLKEMTTRDSFLSEPWNNEMVMEAYNVIASLTSMERETTVQGAITSINKFRTHTRLEELRRSTKLWLVELKKRSVKFEEFLQKAGRETLNRSIQRFQRTVFDGDRVVKTDLHISWISEQQLCFQPVFDSENYKDIRDQGIFFALVLKHNSENLKGLQTDCMSVDFHGRPSSSIRFMGARGVMRDGFNGEHCAGIMHETTVDIKARYKMLENYEPGTACGINTREDSEYDCYLRCRLNSIRKLCNCTAPTLSYLVQHSESNMCDYATCTIPSQNNNNNTVFSENDCINNCLRSCDQFRFRVEHKVKGRSINPDITTILLNWGSFEYLTLEQQLQYTVTSFIGTLGGAIGVWLGLSMLSLIQGTTYLYGYVADTVAKKRRSSSIASFSKSIEDSKSSTLGLGSQWKSALEKLEAERLAANPLHFPYKKMRSLSREISKETLY